MHWSTRKNRAHSSLDLQIEMLYHGQVAIVMVTAHICDVYLGASIRLTAAVFCCMRPLPVEW